ncbi:MAG: hypothetical protein J7K61_06375 [Thermoplasmata archaeon]|nr:hypothetical protein [Thermoplasmata archaeon]
MQKSEKMKKKKDLQQRIQELEDELRYNEAMIEELYEKQEALFPVFADLIKLISRIYKEMKIEDEDVKNCINRLRDTFNEDNILKKYAMRDDEDFSVAYT